MKAIKRFRHWLADLIKPKEPRERKVIIKTGVCIYCKKNRIVRDRLCPKCYHEIME